MTMIDSDFIPFNVPSITSRERKTVLDALEERHLSGDGRFTAAASELLSKLLDGRPVLITTSCTHALEMSAVLLDLRPGDEVIVPSFTFVSTANAFVARGAVPVFVDVRSDTLNIDETAVEEAITERTRAIVVVHYGGVGADMDRLVDVAQRHDLTVVEDNAHGLGATYRGRPLGTFGSLATQSFHATKNIQSGEGGALVLGDPGLKPRAEIVREKGTNRSQFFRGAIDKYTWVDVGSSYLPSELISALLFAQLERFDEIQERRHAVWGSYARHLTVWAEKSGVRLPTVPAECSHPAHLFYLVMPEPNHQTGLIDHLAEKKVGAAFHYLPLHSSPGGRRYGRMGGPCSVTEQVADRLVRLPLYTDMEAADVERVIDAVTSYTI
jgi:dTDP-4-amino-4,6-dideoxygalactose transaminase